MEGQKLQNHEIKLQELDKKIDELTKNIAIMGNDLRRHGDILEKLVANSEKLTIFVTKTNENDKKINVLFKKLDDVYMNGTKNCPVHMQRLNELEARINRTNARLDNLNKWLVSALITVVLQFLFIILHILEKVHL